MTGWPVVRHLPASVLGGAGRGDASGRFLIVNLRVPLWPRVIVAFPPSLAVLGVLVALVCTVGTVREYETVRPRGRGLLVTSSCGGGRYVQLGLRRVRLGVSVAVVSNFRVGRGNCTSLGLYMLVTTRILAYLLPAGRPHCPSGWQNAPGYGTKPRQSKETGS